MFQATPAAAAMRLFALLAVFVCVAAEPAWAQGTPYAMPPGDYVDISTGSNGVPFNGGVSAFAVAPDGSVYAGGSFSVAGGVAASQVARWSGTEWSALGGGVAGDGVSALAVGPDGSVYAGGFLMRPDGSTHAAERWTGTEWEVLGGSGLTGARALIVGPDGTLYYGGYYNESTLTGGAVTARVARWTGTAWETLGMDLLEPLPYTGLVNALVMAPDGTLYAGGGFTKIGGVDANGVARWTGTSWEPLGTGMNWSVSALAVGPDGSLYAGGIFRTAGGLPADRIARWDGTSWEPVGGGMDNAVQTLAFAPDGVLYAGGLFTSAGDGFANKIARWDGTAWRPVGAGVNGFVHALALTPSGSLYVGGAFTRAGSVVSPYVSFVDDPRMASAEDDRAEGSVFGLSVSPNPVAAGGKVRLTLAEAGLVRVTVVDVLGRQVAVLAEGVRGAGEHTVGLGAERLVPGVYVVRVTAGASSAVRRLTVSR